MKRQTRTRLLPLALLALLMAFGTVLAPATSRAQDTSSARFFPETGFSIPNDAFWNYFQRRGGLRTFGYPTSREFLLEGFRVQFFQRQVMQLGPDGQVRLLNLLDSGVLPYTRMNGSTFPGPAEALINAAPSPASPAYAESAVAFLREVAPDTWEGRSVNFGSTALSLVRYEDAFPQGDGPASLVPLINVLEITGLPVSAPAVDPTNNNFVYQRFQRLILQFDATNNSTQALLLADMLKALLTGQNLPADLEAQAQNSKYLRQYDRRRAASIARPSVLGNSDLTNAFEREDRPLPPIDFLPTARLEVSPQTVALGATFSITVSGTDDAGIDKLIWYALDSGVPELDQAHEADCAMARECVRSWNAVSRVPGTLRVRAVARDSAGQDSDVARRDVEIVNRMQGALEFPAPDTRVGGTVTVSGWAADVGAEQGTGVQAVHVYLDGAQGEGFFLGSAEYGEERGDIARRLGDERFRHTGFRLEWDTARVAPGEHTLNVYALSAVTGRWEQFTSRFAIVERPFASDPIIRIFEPRDATSHAGSGSLIRGWAIDRNAAAGTGVDRVEVWLDGERNRPGAVKLGDAVYGNRVQNAVDEFGDARFAPSGFQLVWNPNQFRQGEHVLYVYAHSTHTDTWSLRRIPIEIR